MFHFLVTPCLVVVVQPCMEWIPRAFSSSLLRVISACNHLPFFKTSSNFEHFCPNFQIFFPFLPFFQHFFALFLKIIRMLVLPRIGPDPNFKEKIELKDWIKKMRLKYLKNGKKHVYFQSYDYNVKHSSFCIFYWRQQKISHSLGKTFKCNWEIFLSKHDE